MQKSTTPLAKAGSRMKSIKHWCVSNASTLFGHTLCARGYPVVMRDVHADRRSRQHKHTVEAVSRDELTDWRRSQHKHIVEAVSRDVHTDWRRSQHKHSVEAAINYEHPTHNLCTYCKI
jgi:hypothetical protein